MQITHPTWILALLCLLGSRVTAFPSEMQADEDSNILQDVIDQYIKPYVEPVADRIKASPLYTNFRNMVDKVNEAKDETIRSLAMISVPLIWGPLDRLSRETKPVFEFVKNIFWEKNEQ
ncbi:hypothetical protein XENTR_v10019260 [Xenopus tropicalis]|uniref:Uncharacterized protein LOC100489282 n=1 Tax=Xenopus tropicalis TaxID=8364 RepID=A0A8J0QUT5_XENTR|nr:uncharacterized protein LOC100489282 [Xenopus tropicalis]KAE8593682.1 hypothetical protein XENTR_v10019260 [Xenopus tropicalis]|eukprot:XP_002941079.1 PREDICTED: uncharacterized protein LOC100489282 [Xenopus tropicalis]